MVHKYLIHARYQHSLITSRTLCFNEFNNFCRFFSGSQWSPKTMSGNLLLINGLLFALIIYNSFAAFITSVLSVNSDEIKDLKDLINSDYAFGYTLGNSDELFLRV